MTESLQAHSDHWLTPPYKRMHAKTIDHVKPLLLLLKSELHEHLAWIDLAMDWDIFPTPNVYNQCYKHSWKTVCSLMWGIKLFGISFSLFPEIYITVEFYNILTKQICTSLTHYVIHFQIQIICVYGDIIC